MHSPRGRRLNLLLESDVKINNDLRELGKKIIN